MRKGFRATANGFSKPCDIGKKMRPIRASLFVAPYVENFYNQAIMNDDRKLSRAVPSVVFIFLNSFLYLLYLLFETRTRKCLTCSRNDASIPSNLREREEV